MFGDRFCFWLLLGLREFKGESTFIFKYCFNVVSCRYEVGQAIITDLYKLRYLTVTIYLKIWVSVSVSQWVKMFCRPFVSVGMGPGLSVDTKIHGC